MSILKKEKSKKIPTIKNNLFMLKILWEISPKIIIYTFIPEFLGFASWAAFNVLFMKYIFSGLYEISFLSSVLFVVGFAVFTAIVTIVSNWSGDRFKRKMEPKIHQKINKMMFDKASSVDIACFETPEFYDDYTKATVEAYTRAISVLNSTSNLIGALFASLWVIGSMFQINVIAGIFAFLPMIGNFFFGKILNRLYYNQNLDNVPYKRRQDYANRAMYLQKFAKEMRLSKIFGVIKDIYISGYDGIIKNVNKYRVPIFWLSDTRNALCFPVVFEGMWLFAAYLAMVTKTILITEFAVLARSIVSTTWMLTAFTDSLNNCLQNGLYVENLKDFLNYKADIPEEQDGLPVPQFIESLELKSVSFLYKGSKETVIKNVSILLSAGEKVSLVGHNGAGKSTLIKLIMRFYDPTSGVILLNGRDIRLYNLKAYRGLIGTT